MHATAVILMDDAHSGAEGPWDHATRLERIAVGNGTEKVPLKFVGVADPNIDKARAVIAGRASQVVAVVAVFSSHSTHAFAGQHQR